MQYAVPSKNLSSQVSAVRVSLLAYLLTYLLTYFILVSDAEPLELHFRVKYYPSDPEKLREELTRCVVCEECYF